MKLTAEMPTPGASPGRFPAAEKAIGTMLAIPSPARAKPAAATGTLPANAASQQPRPGHHRREPQRQHRPQPVADRIAAEPHSAIVAEKAAKASPAASTEAAELLLR